MKTKLFRTAVLLVGISIVLFACEKMEENNCSQPVTLDLPETPYDYSSVDNGGIVMMTGVNSDMATLGRVLFYDNHLSVNNSISCGTCHKQTLAFSDNVEFSNGFQNHKTLRNTLPIQNLSNNTFFSFGQPSLFWDGRASFLPTMVLMPITNHVEMGMGDVNSIVERVKAQSFYKDLFIAAYGSPEINIQNIANALGSFVSSIFSGSTRVDKSNNNLLQLTALEEQGKNLFFNKYNCNGCHQTQVLNGYELGGGFVNIGLDEVYDDKGLQGVTNDPMDNGKFKIPSLRNIALTAPYMHDGRFKTLDAVLNHYSHGVANSAALDPRLKDSTTGRAKDMNIAEHEKTALIAFMNALTDYSMITDAKFSNPFKVR